MSEEAARPWLRGIVLAALAATVVATWNLWQARTAPPLVPWLDLAAPSFGWLLLGAMLAAMWRPRTGTALLVVLFAWACLVDQTRLQPQVVSLCLLLAATTSSRDLQLLGRLHLVTLWFYAGVAKLASEPFLFSARPWLLGRIVDSPPAWLQAAFPWLVVAAEIGLALLALVPRTRRLAVVVAVALHGAILFALVPHDNVAVWPWNVALAAAAGMLIGTWRTPIAEDVGSAHVVTRLLAAVLVLGPLTSYAGIGDPYLAHQLYTANVPTGLVCRVDGGRPWLRQGLNGRYRDPAAGLDCLVIDLIGGGLGVPAPPRPSYFAGYFRRDCRPGERLVILDHTRRVPVPKPADRCRR